MLSALYEPWIFDDPIYFSFTRVVVTCILSWNYKKLFTFSSFREPLSQFQAEVACTWYFH